MTELVINDLPQNAELDRAARSTIFGGISFGWIQLFPRPQASPSMMPGITSYNYTITNNFIENNYKLDYTLVEQNPTNIFVKGGSGNTGSVTNITAMPIMAAAPTQLG
jgi:hypothetical protein